MSSDGSSEQMFQKILLPPSSVQTNTPLVVLVMAAKTFEISEHFY
jgi:hypothetical protein